MNEPNVELIDPPTNPGKKIAEAASECYDSKPSKAIVEHCIDSGHTSVTEFTNFHFRISNVSRTLTHQLVRHRHASYAQRSQRYVKEDGFDVVIPEKIAEKDDLCEMFQKEVGKIRELYEKMIEEGVPEEDARYILPNATHTSIHVQMNMRALMHFCNERMCDRAQWEIRELAYEIKRLVLSVSPFLGKYLVPKCGKIGYCPESEDECCGKYKEFQ